MQQSITHVQMLDMHMAFQDQLQTADLQISQLQQQLVEV